MDGNIYNKISQEINFKLPDINFDSDSDDMENDKPIKPYIRPAADILFGWDSSESEELMAILSKMPSDSIQVNKTESIPTCKSVVDKDTSLQNTEKLPFMNISLPNGIRTHVPPEFEDDEDRIMLSNFGLRDDLDLDKVLDEMDLSDCQTTFFDEVLTNMDDTVVDVADNNDNVSTLLSRLDEMSKKYVECRHSTNNNNAENCHKGNTSISLSNLFNQLKFESARETVILDLRVENNLWSTEINAETTTAFKHQINQMIREEESSDEEEEHDDNTETGGKSELWIDSYRKSKKANQNSCMQFSPDVENYERKTNLNREIFSVKSTASIVTEPEKDSGVFMECEVDQDKTIPEHVRIKIEKIKQREKVLSERRTMGHKLNRLLPVSDDSPLLFHEELSFDTSMMALLPPIDFGPDGDVQYFRARIALSTPNIVLTMSKVPSPIRIGYPNENFSAILTVLLQLTKDSATKCPFIVIGLQQIHYEGQLQLSLLCRTVLSLTNLKLELKKYSLRELTENGCVSGHVISDLPLSNILHISPYNAVIDGNIWNWNNSSIVWKKLTNDDTLYDDHNGCRPLDIGTSCIVLPEEFYLSGEVYVLLMKLLDKCTISGIRLLYDKDENKHLVLAVRGYDSVNIIKVLQNKSPLYRAHVTCTRFQENSLKELVKYFGPRVNDQKITKMFEDNRDRDIANDLSEGLSIYHSVYYCKPSDVMLLVAPTCLDMGWLLNTLLTAGGFRIVNMTRLELSISVARQFGINEQLIDNFESTNGPCHLLIIRNEQPMHTIKCALNECSMIIHNDGENISKIDQIFYYLPYSKALLDLLDLQKMTQTPSIRELALNIPDSPFDDSEQCSFVLLISDELTRHLAQLLDQMSNLDLLAVKCMTKWPSNDHLSLIQTQFRLHLPILNAENLFEETEGKMRIAVLVVRSMFLIKELEKIQSTIRVEKNLIFAYTMNVSVTFGLVGSFFTSSELISDTRRRSALKFLPDDIISKLATVSVLAQFPVIYAPIQSALSIKIKNTKSVTSQFKKLWFLLTRDGFTVSDVFLDDTMQMSFIVKRPNAIFYLIQWTKAHFSDDNTVIVATNSVEINNVQSKIVKSSSGRTIKSVSVSGTFEKVVFIMLNESLLESSPEMLSAMKVFWSFLEENDYHCESLCLRTVDGSDIFKLKDVSIRNLDGSQLRHETRYLCLLIAGGMEGKVIEDMLRCKIKLLNTELRLRQDIYVCGDRNEIVQCCNILVDGNVHNHSNLDIAFN